ncbi:MAG TPA: hypothetical protein VKK79_15570 [Candidatus Lokiarchaeia archaeon]|nr:hypothetical protein [Candidatus Lokiarchaeia archaeon]
MSTVRLDERHAKMLDDIRARCILRGVKVTKQELMSRLIERASEDETLVFGHEAKVPATGEIKVFDWGVDDTSSTVDKYLYGEQEDPEEGK